MEKGKIFSEMIPEVELSGADLVELRAFSVLDRVHLKHVPLDKVLARFKTTWQEVAPFEKKWEEMRQMVHI